GQVETISAKSGGRGTISGLNAPDFAPPVDGASLFSHDFCGFSTPLGGSQNRRAGNGRFDGLHGSTGAILPAKSSWSAARANARACIRSQHDGRVVRSAYLLVRRRWRSAAI